MAASKLLAGSIALILVSLFASSAIGVCFLRRKRRLGLEDKLRELEQALKTALENCASERRGRIRAQQALREDLAKVCSHDSDFYSYPMTPIATVQSCFSTRNGTPRQPLLVPLARARLLFNLTRVPPASLEGLEGYSHCWIIYVFHQNTDLEKLWKNPSRSKFKAKVRVPRLKGGRMGVFATRSPHRPCPIGLTVAKVESVCGGAVILSGIDLVDGTPVLDVKPYLPYCDSIVGATLPDWVKGDELLAVSSISFSEDFSSSLSACWPIMEKKSLYSSSHEFQCLIRQVLSWDIRSVSQRIRPHISAVRPDNGIGDEHNQDLENSADLTMSEEKNEDVNSTSSDSMYHLILEGLDISYRIDCSGNVLVEKVNLSPCSKSGNAVAKVL
ncbi:unnamed protein product [Cuscuta epithymum]|uniref:TsaA-like domain-containing protein n=1 Tax=Cuscuta epithymum TaxID=186058 RepID=A0AAV0FZG6_9ASTE|nr:unnamed protein product [Cuscuta epithymum]